MKKQDLVFTTRRLRVHRFIIVPDPSQGHCLRDIFVAFRTDVDCPMAILTATFWDDPRIRADWNGVQLEMIEVNDLHRRKGLAKEFCAGAAKFYGIRIVGEPVTPTGRRLMDSISRTGVTP